MKVIKNFDKNKIHRNFNKAAIGYNDNALLQKTIAKKLVDLSFNYLSSAKTILDLGAGTGFIAENIFPFLNNNAKFFQLDIAYEMLKLSLSTQKNIFNINGDIENLPFKNQNFDLVISSMTLQWINNLENIFPQIIQLLKKDGVLAFALPVEDSLNELKQSCKAVNINLSINDFPKIDLIKKKFILVKTEKIILYYNDLYQLLKSIKSIGGGYNFANKSNLTKRDFERINNFYLKNFSLNSKIFCSWNISYVFYKNSFHLR